LSDRTRGPTISLGVLTAALAALLALPSKAAENVYIKPFVGSVTATVLWWLLVVVTVFGWAVLWFLRKRATTMLDSLYSLQTHRLVLDKVVDRIRWQGPGRDVVFSRWEFRERLLIEACHGVLQTEASRDLPDLPREQETPNSPTAWTYRVRRWVGIRVDIRAARRVLIPDTVDNATDLALQRFVDRGWILDVQGRPLEEWFALRDERDPNVR
jgi:hypothetical protein